MKKFAKKLGLHKTEAERTKTQKIVRDIAFFGVVVYAAVMTFLVFNAQTQQIEAEADLISANMAVSQLTLAR